MTRVLAIGLDAVEASFVERLIELGHLPALHDLRRSAATVRLQTPRPYRSEYPWTEFLTGQSSESTRYWSTLTFDPETYECVVTGAAPVAPFYALGDQRRVVALDVPHSRISGDVVGAQVIGWGCHDPQFPRCSAPDGLLTALERRHGMHDGIAIEYDGSWNQSEFLSRFSDRLIEGCRRRVDVVASLMQQVSDWDLFVLTMSEAHTARHQMWHGIDDRSLLHHAPTSALAAERLTAIHVALDESIGRIRDLAPPDTVLAIFSVKGMEATDADVLAPALVPELLHRLTFGRGLLRPMSQQRRGSMIPSPIVLGPSQRPIASLRARFADTRPQRLKRAIRSALPGMVELRRRRASASASPERDREPILDVSAAVDGPEPDRSTLDGWHTACWYRRYWHKMPAFVIPSFSDLHLRVNLVGRERNGRVSAAEYDAKLDELETLLRDCTDPRTGRAAFGHVTRVRDGDAMALDGPSADLVVECAERTDTLSHPRVGVLGPFPFPRVGAHTPNGFAWFAGSGIAPGDHGTRAAIDLPPTLLEMIGMEVPSSLEGTPIRL